MNKSIDPIIELLEIQNKLKNNIISNLEILEDIEILRLVNAIVEESNRINEKKTEENNSSVFLHSPILKL